MEVDRPAHILEGKRIRFRCICNKATVHIRDPGDDEYLQKPAPHFSVAVSCGGGVYTWGDGAFGQLGHNNTATLHSPKQVYALSQHRVLSVAAGFAHCLVVTERGELFSWGNDQSGQCGNGNCVYDPQLLPRRVLCDVSVRSASAGQYHSLVVTDDGVVFAFGDYLFRMFREVNWYGYEVEYEGDDPCGPVVVQFAVRIRSVAAGKCHALAVSDAGAVFSWGKNFYGELGLGFRAGHDGIWGGQRVGDADIDFQCGYSPVTVPALLDLNDVVAVEAGSFASCAVTRSGSLFTWGAKSSYFPVNMHFIAKPEQTVPYRINELNDVASVSMSASNSHTLAITRDGVVYGWGSVEELNFGVYAVAATSVASATSIATAIVYEYAATSPRLVSSTRLQAMWQFLEYFI